MAVIDELLVGLGFDYNDKQLSKFKKDIGETTEIVKKLARAVAGTTAALFGFTVASTAASDEQGKLADEVGESVETIDSLQFALTRSGGSAEGMSNSLRQLSLRVSEASRGLGAGVEAFGLLGINVKKANGELKPTSEIFSEISKQFQNLDRAQQIELADKLGVRDSVRLLQQGPAAIRDLTNEAKALGVTTDEDAALAAEFQDSLTDLWRIIKDLSRTITKELVPVFRGIIDSFVDWWKINRDIIKQKVPEIIDKITLAVRFMVAAFTAFIGLRVITTLISMLSLVKKITIGIATMNATALLLPGLIVGAITAIAALAQDAIVFFEGGDSFLGEMIEKFPEWADEIRVVSALFATMATITDKIVEGWKGIIAAVTDENSDFSGFILDALGINTTEDRARKIESDRLRNAQQLKSFSDRGLISASPNARGFVSVDNIEINIPNVTDGDDAAKAVVREFLLTSQNLSSGVDQ